jgi:cytochrome c oxidase assembly protein Cox11
MGINESVFANAASMLIKKSGFFIRDCVFTFAEFPFYRYLSEVTGIVGRDQSWVAQT